MPPFHTLPQLQPCGGQLQNLGVSGGDKALPKALATELGFAHGTCRHNLRALVHKPTPSHEGLTCKAEGTQPCDDAPQQTPDPVTGPAKRQGAIPCLVMLRQPSRERRDVRGGDPVQLHAQQRNELPSRRFQKALGQVFISLRHTKFRAFTTMLSAWHSQ